MTAGIPYRFSDGTRMGHTDSSGDFIDRGITHLDSDLTILLHLDTSSWGKQWWWRVVTPDEITLDMGWSVSPEAALRAAKHAITENGFTLPPRTSLAAFKCL